MGDNFTGSLLAALEDNLVAERFRLILQPTINSKLEPVTSALQQTVLDLQQAVGTLQATVARKDDEISTLRREVRDLRDHAEALEQHSRRASVWVFGIPENTPGTTDDKLLDLCNNRMKIRPPLSPDDIEVSHRVGKLVATVPQQGESPVVRPRPIIVKFLSRRTKARVMAKRKNLRGINTTEADDDAEAATEGHTEDTTDADSLPSRTLYPLPVYMSGDLISSRAKLAFKARELKRNGRISDTWVFDCQVSIKDNRNRIDKVNKMEDLNEYLWFTQFIYHGYITDNCLFS